MGLKINAVYDRKSGDEEHERLRKEFRQVSRIARKLYPEGWALGGRQITKKQRANGQNQIAI